MKYHLLVPVSYKRVALSPAASQDISDPIFAALSVTVWSPVLEDIIIILICPSTPAANVKLPAPSTLLINVTFVSNDIAPIEVIVS